MPYDNAHLFDRAEAALADVSGIARQVMQKTLATSVECCGVGVHSGAKVTMKLSPAAENTGIVFVRTDLVNGARRIPARWDHVVETRLCTVIGNKAGAQVATIEHVMAALYAYGIDNAEIEVNAPEVPVMDGSSDPFVFLIEMAGVVEQNAPRRLIEVIKSVEFTEGNKRVALVPCSEQRFSVTIAFDQEAIGQQRHDILLTPESFKSEISRARTFGFFEEIDHLKKQGFARGGSLDNAVVIKGDHVMNEDGLRYGNEFARHKVLDAVGDMALAGYAIRGRFDGFCSGHAMNNKLLRALFADRAAWRYVTADDHAAIHEASIMVATRRPHASASVAA